MYSLKLYVSSSCKYKLAPTPISYFKIRHCLLRTPTCVLSAWQTNGARVNVVFHSFIIIIIIRTSMYTIEAEPLRMYISVHAAC